MILKDKIAFVTGGSRGIGKVICIALAEAGAKVVLTYKSNELAANEIVSTISKNSGSALAIKMDVQDRASVNKAFKKCLSNYSGLDILINNAGINRPTDFDKITDDDWEDILSVNLKGPFICSQEALPLMSSKGRGCILNIGSVSGQYGGPRTAHYAASKAGLISLGQVIARYGANKGIRCNTLAAGLIASPMAEDSLKSSAVNKAQESILLGRLGEAEEVAKAVIFLVSDNSSYITGQTINVNGGLYF